MKEAYYFSHDANAVRDPKIIKLLSKYGWAGYGMFWALIEMLHEQSGKIKFEDNLEVFSWSLKISSEEAFDFIKFLQTIELLVLDDEGFLYSKRLLQSIEKVSELKEKKQLAGKKSGEVRRKKALEKAEQDESDDEQDISDDSSEEEHNRNGNGTDDEQVFNTSGTEMNKGKEKKGKEKKENIISSPQKSSISEEGLEFARYFRTLLPPTQKITDADLRNWGDTFDKLIRIDKRPRDEIYQIAEWARKDSFWGEKGNFLSACKLRNKSKDGVMYYDIFLQKFKQERRLNGSGKAQVQRPAWITAEE
jgi:hypothetical protein